MNFEQLYQKYKNGTATAEEISLVEAEIEKAKRVSAILNEESDSPAETPELEPAELETVKKAKKAFNIRSTVRTAVITFVCVAVLAAIAAGAVFGIAFFSANSAKTVTEENAIDISKDYLAAHLGISDLTGIIVSEYETELDIGSKLTDSHYVYEIELIYGDYKYQIDVSSQSGYAVISDKESISGTSENRSKNKTVTSGEDTSYSKRTEREKEMTSSVE